MHGEPAAGPPTVTATVKPMTTDTRVISDKQIESVIAFRNSLTPETDRGCALMAAAFLDAELEKLIRASLIDDKTDVDGLLGPSSPLGSFSSRIEIAYLLGLIGPAVKRDLHLIRKIRNDFGHKSEPISFDTAEIASRCRELKHTWHKQDTAPRSRFTNAVIGVLASIHAATMASNRPSARQDIEITDEQKAALRAKVEEGDRRVRHQNRK